MEKEAAIDAAIDSCINDGILADLLLKHKAEVKDMIWTEYNEEEVYRLMRRDAKEEGLEEGFYVGDFEARYKYSLKDAESHSLTESIGATCEISPEFTFAAGVAAYGLVLLDSEYKADATLSMAKELVAGAAGEDSFRKQLVSLIEKAGPRSK